MALWKLGAVIIVAAGIGLLAARLRPRRRKSAHEPVATKVDAPAPYGAVSVRCGREACEAVRRLAAKRLLPKEAPRCRCPNARLGTADAIIFTTPIAAAARSAAADCGRPLPGGDQTADWEGVGGGGTSFHLESQGMR